MNKKIIFVPTMGNLHLGHMALIHCAKLYNEKVVCSIFVNALQFDCEEDLNAYPRTLQEDLNVLNQANVDAVFIPEHDEIYSVQNEISEVLPKYELSKQLCGKFRPGFFEGIIEVVARLFNIVTPDVAIFGEKDYQQLIIIKKLVADLNLPVKIEQVATQREMDGLAYSSRNSYLNEVDRARAPHLYEELEKIKERIMQGDRDYENLENMAIKDLKLAGFRPDYVAIRCGYNLRMPTYTTEFIVILAAAWLAEARLIDNVLLHIS